MFERSLSKKILTLEPLSDLQPAPPVGFNLTFMCPEGQVLFRKCSPIMLCLDHRIALIVLLMAVLLWLWSIPTNSYIYVCTDAKILQTQTSGVWTRLVCHPICPPHLPGGLSLISHGVVLVTLDLMHFMHYLKSPLQDTGVFDDPPWDGYSCVLRKCQTFPGSTLNIKFPQLQPLSVLIALRVVSTKY